MKHIFKIGGVLISNRDDIDFALHKIFSETSKPIIIFSAINKSSRELLTLIKQSEQGNYNHFFQNFIQKHLDFVVEQKSVDLIDSLSKNLNDYLKAISITGECTAQAKDKILSFGEKLAGIIYLESAQKIFTTCKLLDSEKFIKTNSEFGNAQVNLDESSKKIKSLNNLNETLLVPGFIGSDKNYQTTTMGFESSNLTSIIFAIAFNSKTVTWFTDVDGIYSADPKLYLEARLIQNIDYTEAEELGDSGLKLIPKNLIKLAEKYDIEIEIKSIDSKNQTKISNKKSDNFFLIDKNIIKIIGDPKKIITKILDKDYDKVIIEKNSIEIKSQIPTSSYLAMINDLC